MYRSLSLMKFSIFKGLFTLKQIRTSLPDRFIESPVYVGIEQRQRSMEKSLSLNVDGTFDTDAWYK